MRLLGASVEGRFRGKALHVFWWGGRVGWVEDVLVEVALVEGVWMGVVCVGDI